MNRGTAKRTAAEHRVQRRQLHPLPILLTSHNLFHVLVLPSGRVPTGFPTCVASPVRPTYPVSIYPNGAICRHLKG
jgi:hypothetical protein